MPESMKIAYSAGALFPGPETVVLCGRPREVLQFRVKDIGQIERDFAAIVGSPAELLSPRVAVMKDAERRKAEDKEGYLDACRAVVEVFHDFPARLGGEKFAEVIATADGVLAYLRTALGRTDPGLTEEDCLAILTDMDRGDWSRLERVLWGMAPWEVAKGDDHPAQAMDWGRLVLGLIEHHKMSMGEIGNLFVSQFFYLLHVDPAVSPTREVFYHKTWDEDAPVSVTQDNEFT